MMSHICLLYLAILEKSVDRYCCIDVILVVECSVLGIFAFEFKGDHEVEAVEVLAFIKIPPIFNLVHSD